SAKEESGSDSDSDSSSDDSEHKKFTKSKDVKSISDSKQKVLNVSTSTPLVSVVKHNVKDESESSSSEDSSNEDTCPLSNNIIKNKPSLAKINKQATNPVHVATQNINNKSAPSKTTSKESVILEKMAKKQTKVSHLKRDDDCDSISLLDKQENKQLIQQNDKKSNIDSRDQGTAVSKCKPLTSTVKHQGKKDSESSDSEDSSDEDASDCINNIPKNVISLPKISKQATQSAIASSPIKSSTNASTQKNIPKKSTKLKKAVNIPSRASQVQIKSDSDSDTSSNTSQPSQLIKSNASKSNFHSRTLDIHASISTALPQIVKHQEIKQSGSDSASEDSSKDEATQGLKNNQKPELFSPKAKQSKLPLVSTSISKISDVLVKKSQTSSDSESSEDSSIGETNKQNITKPKKTVSKTCGKANKDSNAPLPKLTMIKASKNNKKTLKSASKVSAILQTSNSTNKLNITSKKETQPSISDSKIIKNQSFVKNITCVANEMGEKDSESDSSLSSEDSEKDIKSTSIKTPNKQKVGSSEESSSESLTNKPPTILKSESKDSSNSSDDEINEKSVLQKDVATTKSQNIIEPFQSLYYKVAKAGEKTQKELNQSTTNLLISPVVLNGKINKKRKQSANDQKNEISESNSNPIKSQTSFKRVNTTIDELPEQLRNNNFQPKNQNEYGAKAQQAFKHMQGKNFKREKNKLLLLKLDVFF
ncbi:hypothetical protein HZS_2702, partial [Henneguya salminicola]